MPPKCDRILARPVREEECRGKRYWNDWTPVAGQQFEYGFDDIGNRTRR